jgi:gamma-glutamylcyclotransferase (GGCT)/AIG2-like uncharacterized protein YtfP
MTDYVRIFVYGTLQRGMPLNYFMQGADFVEKARTTADYTLTAQGIPFLWHGGETAVDGEVWNVPRGPVLRELMRLEAGYVLSEVSLEDGTSALAWFAGNIEDREAYGPHDAAIRHGSYRNYVNSQEQWNA